MQAVSSGLQNISSKTPRDPVAAAMVSDAVRIIDNYIKVVISHAVVLSKCMTHCMLRLVGLYVKVAADWQRQLCTLW